MVMSVGFANLNVLGKFLCPTPPLVTEVAISPPKFIKMTDGFLPSPNFCECVEFLYKLLAYFDFCMDPIVVLFAHWLATFSLAVFFGILVVCDDLENCVMANVGIAFMVQQICSSFAPGDQASKLQTWPLLA
jgi:hypothetical protein